MTLWLVLAACSKDAPDTASATDLADPDAFATIVADKVPTGMLLSAWATTDGHAVAVGGDLGGGPGVVARFDGIDLCVEAEPARRALWWIHGVSDDEWYAVGVEGTIVHSVNGVRTDESVPTKATLFGVMGTADDLWAVGGDTFTTFEGEIWRRQGGVWSRFDADLPGVLFKAWERWIIGDGVAYWWDGSQLVERHPPGGERLITIHGSGPDDAWAVGGIDTPILLHWTGGAWSAVEVDLTCALRGLNGVFVDGDHVYVAGHYGDMAAFDGTTWSCPDEPLTSEHFHAVRKLGDAVWWWGGNIFDAGGNYGTIARLGGGQPPVGITDCP